METSKKVRLEEFFEVLQSQKPSKTLLGTIWSMRRVMRKVEKKYKIHWSEKMHVGGILFWKRVVRRQNIFYLHNNGRHVTFVRKGSVSVYEYRKNVPIHEYQIFTPVFEKKGEYGKVWDIL